MSYEEALFERVQRRQDLIVLTAENRAHIRSLPERLGARFIDVGIAEQTLVGMAAGLAHRGRTPVVHALAPFLTMRAFEFIRTDVGLRRLPVKLVGMIPGFLSDANGPTHQALEDIALMRAIPGMSVLCPADAVELEALLDPMLDAPGPCYLRYTEAPRLAPEAPSSLGFGQAEVLSEGDDVTLLSYGLLLTEAREARKLLQAAGLSTGLVNVRWLAPLDSRAISAAARRSRRLVTIEDHFATGGLFSAVSELVARQGLACRVEPLALEARWFAPGLLPEILEHEGFTARHIVERVLSHGDLR